MSKTKAPTKAKAAAAKPLAAAPAPQAPEATANDATTAAFLREVDTAMQVEKWQNLWNTFRWPLLGAVVLAIAAVGAREAYNTYQDTRHAEMAEGWYALLRETDDAKMQAALPGFVKESADGYRALGQLALATSDATQATTQYRALADDRSQPDWVRAIAELNHAISLLGTDPATAQTSLETIAQTAVPGAGSTPLPTVPLALELLALLAIQRNDTATARGYTERLLALPELGITLTPALQQRAQQRLGMLQTL